MPRVNTRNLKSLWLRIRDVLVRREYCRWASPYLAMVCQPLEALALAAAAALVCGVFVAPQGFVVFAAVAAVIAIGCVWPSIGLRGLTCELRFAASRIEEGKPVDVELIINNRCPWSVWGLAVEGGFGSGPQPDNQPAIAISRIGGWTRGRYRWQFVPSMRGRYPNACPEIVSEFPFGLWKARKPIAVLSTLVAWPLRFPLPMLVLPCGTTSWSGQPSERSAGNVGHRTSVREYRRGDSMRQIHWAKTALYDKLVSYEQEGLAVTRATISLDTHPDLHRETGPQSTLEWSIRIAASIGDAFLRQGVAVAVNTHADRSPAKISPSNPTALLDWLALLNDGAHAVQGVGAKSSPRTSLPGLTLHITTDLSPNVAGDSIVLRTKRNSVQATISAISQRCWIAVNREADIPLQIRRGWRNGPRRLNHAV